MRTLCTHVTRRRLARGELLFGEGDQCKGLFVVAIGTIRIFKLSPTGREQVLAVEGPGSSLADLPVFDGGVYAVFPNVSYWVRFQEDTNEGHELYR
jgi:CRP-like cAMP-binding protein